VIDFGSLKPIKAMLVENFDHRTILAENDPALEDFQTLYATHGFQEPLVLPFVGCEGFAKFTFDYVAMWLREEHFPGIQVRGLYLAEVEVREHGANCAIYTGG
jgi:6-pyruvoyltetrahydropterin/6-carboxytetrahydropterin synthase